ncbi:MAG: helix-turn-helix domain-containing protein [Naasia sp.]
MTSKWGVLVVVALARESHRFGELRQEIGGVSEKMLTQTLRSLESDGFVDRHSHGTVPPRVDYSLTPLGMELSGVLIPLVRWVGENAENVAEARSARATSD